MQAAGEDELILTMKS